MSQKKPIWTTTEAHERLKAYCIAAGRTQLEVVSELILNFLDEEGKNSTEPGSQGKEGHDKHFGGVWVV